MVEIDFQLDNCGSQSEFVEKAIRFYDGYVHANKTGAYLPHALQEMLEGTLGVFGDRLGKLLFKLVVEHNMTNHLLGGDIDMTRDEYNKMRVTVSGRWRVRMAASPLGMCCNFTGRSNRWHG